MGNKNQETMGEDGARHDFTWELRIKVIIINID